MKKTTGFIIICSLCIILPSFRQIAIFNKNSWKISLGKYEVLSSSKNVLGDTITFEKKKIKSTDTLSASMFFCGSNSLQSTCILIIKNEQNHIITGKIQNKPSFMFSATMPVETIWADQNFKHATFLTVYLYIKSEAEGINHTYLLGSIQCI